MEPLIETFIKVTSINIIRYFVVAGIPFICFYFIFRKPLQRFKIQIKEAGQKDFIREILHSLQTSVIFGLISIVVLFSPLSEYTLLYKSISDYPLWWAPLSLVLALVFHDTYFYWMHRIMHHKSIYKKVHLVHHKSTNPSPWTSYSFHLLEAIVEGLVIVPLVLIIPMHMSMIALFITSGFIINVYGHLGFEILPNRFRNSKWFKILNTSIYHNMHHSHVNGNYSLYFRHWDRWMKTENTKYEQYYDTIIDQRNVRETEYSSPKAKWGILGLLLLLSLGLHPQTAQAQIEGKWKMENSNVIVEVYQINHKYYCKVIDAGEPDKNAMLSKQAVYLFEEMKKDNAFSWSGGNVFHPYKNVHTTGYVKLLPNGQLLIGGTKYYVTEEVKFFRIQT